MRARGSDSAILIRPIGVVRNSITNQNKTAGWTTESRIILRDKYVEALKGLKEYSRLIVLFWLHQARSEAIEFTVRPGGRPNLPEVGIFGTRYTAHRPNRIGLSVTKLLGVRSSIVRVIGLDAFDGSPVIDIKFFMRWDIAGETRMRRRLLDESIELQFSGKVRVPGWWRRF